MNKLWKKGMCLLFAAAAAVSGCASDGKNVEAESSFKIQVDPESFALSVLTEEESILISKGSGDYSVSDYKQEDNQITWSYPEEQIQVSLTQEEDYLSVEITSQSEEDNEFVWPNISAKQYYIPLGEGKRVPADDPAWQAYLNKQEFSVLEQLSMPFWISSAGEYSVLFIMENPYRTKLNFTADSGIDFTVSHQYPEISHNKTNKFRIYLTDHNPVSSAKIYRNYIIEQGKFATLEQKAEKNPDIRKLYGAPFIYLWGDFIISAEDVHWQAFRKSVSSPVISYLLSFADKIENGEEFQNVLNDIEGQDYVDDYQKNVICYYITQVLKKENFFNPSVFLQSSEKLENLLSKGYNTLNETERIQVHKLALEVNLPEVFSEEGQWMKASTTDLIDELKAEGIDQAWIGLNSWEQAYAKPELVRQALEQGYLIASYDSYHSIHKPGEEKWITAKFNDTSLYEKATITNRDGEKEKGFQNVGRKLNPALSLPAVKERMEGIMSNKLPFNSWFIDCDATGEIYDDYSPDHITSEEEDVKARLERMAYIRDQYNLVIGSEGGNDFSASTIAYAHGIELKTFSWMDEDMKSNKDSKYYIGKYYSPDGGVAEHFSKRIPIKDQYYTIFADPKYDVPLFKLVYNDSVITSYHWDWSTFKIQGATQDRMIREVLYNVPPLYHLDSAEWEKYKEDIASHQKVWSSFSKQAITKEMTDFKYLVSDGSVQKTVYGNTLTAVANYSAAPYMYEGREILPHSVYITENGKSTLYTPVLQEESQ